MFSKELNKKLDEYHLLKHPFYKSWNEGKLTREIIKDYAEQYYQHVKAFPRYISATHSICEDLDKRWILLENLQDEEKKGADHPTLWKNFALAIGADEAFRINDDPLDSKQVAFQISNFIKSNSYDLIMMGKESIDFNGGLVHYMVGESLKIPCINPVMKLDIIDDKAKIMREVDEGVEELEVKLPLIVGCQEPIAEWKIPNMRGIMSARSKPLKIIEPIEYNSGFKYSDFSLPPQKESVKIIDKDNLEELINNLKNDSKVI